MWGVSNEPKDKMLDVKLTKGPIVVVDTREKKRTFAALKRQKIPYVLETLPCGDFKSNNCIVERKTTRDLIGSIKSKSGGDSRLFKQMASLSEYCDENDMIPFLAISGDLDETERWFKKKGYSLNIDSLIGAVTSASVRYGINVLAWFRNDDELVKAIYALLTKVDEGKWCLPHRMKMERNKNRKTALWCTILRTTPGIANQLIRKYEGMDKFLEVLKSHSVELEYIRGVGPGTVEKWKTLLL